MNKEQEKRGMELVAKYPALFATIITAKQTGFPMAVIIDCLDFEDKIRVIKEMVVGEEEIFAYFNSLDNDEEKLSPKEEKLVDNLIKSLKKNVE